MTNQAAITRAINVDSFGFVAGGNVWLVDALNGSDTGDGDVTATIQGAINKASPGDTILILPDTYVENLSVPLNKPNLRLLGIGPRLSVVVAPASGIAATALGPQTHVENIDFVGGDGSVGCSVTGDGFTAKRCKFESADDLGIGLKMVPTAVAGSTASLGVVEECEFAWAATGIELNLDTSAVTQMRVSRCWFHNLSTAAIGEGASGGTCRNLVVEDCTFDDAEDGTAPTAYIALNETTSNTNTGVVTRCSFPTAIDSGKNVVSTGIHWVSNFHTGGVSAAQPS